ncbi:hypothetical protein SUNI508_09677 [Seiridium unicorne]|uniref:Uncharacterized protein n=1 Tax=Seiridium unicorne TaxID=138068 RepID=A0ABR2UQ62_9PEZI
MCDTSINSRESEELKAKTAFTNLLRLFCRCIHFTFAVVHVRIGKNPIEMADNGQPANGQPANGGEQPRVVEEIWEDIEEVEETWEENEVVETWEEVHGR